MSLLTLFKEVFGFSTPLGDAIVAEVMDPTVDVGITNVTVTFDDGNVVVYEITGNSHEYWSVSAETKARWFVEGDKPLYVGDSTVVPRERVLTYRKGSQRSHHVPVNSDESSIRIISSTYVPTLDDKEKP